MPKTACRWLAVLITTLLILSGCQKNVVTETPDSTSKKSGRIPISAEDVLPVDDPGLKQDEPIEVSSNDPDAEPDSSDHETTSQDQVATDSDNTGTAEDGDSEAEEQEEEVPQGGDVHPPAQTGTVDGSTPSRNDERAGGALRLIGIAIGQSMQDVTSRFQKPRDQYRMQDPGGAVTVYEYDGFTIGFNDNSRVEFIDVYSAEVDPILNGVRVGSTAAEAEKRLGPPSSRSEYVLNYIAGGVVMKIDLAPVSSRILSIKLFAED